MNRKTQGLIKKKKSTFVKFNNKFLRNKHKLLLQIDSYKCYFPMEQLNHRIQINI